MAHDDPAADAGGLRYTVILVPDVDGQVAVSVPAMPGCFSAGTSRDEALTHIREAMYGWLATESEAGRQPLRDTPAVIDAGVHEALEIIAAMRAAGDVPPERGHDLELTTIEAYPSRVT